jgi:hypothetical protein
MTGQTAPQPFVFELNRLIEYTDAAILDELRRVAVIVPGGPLLATTFQRHSRVSRDTVSKRFGSWSKALDAAGLSYRWGGRTSVRGGKARVIYEMTNEEMLASITELAHKLGKDEISVLEVEAPLPFGRHSLLKRWAL